MTPVPLVDPPARPAGGDRRHGPALVGVDGHPAEVSVQQSSRHREFDQAARRQVLRFWRFRPAMQAGRAVQAIGIVPIEFKLGR